MCRIQSTMSSLSFLLGSTMTRRKSKSPTRIYRSIRMVEKNNSKIDNTVKRFVYGKYVMSMYKYQVNKRWMSSSYSNNYMYTLGENIVYC